MASVVQFMHKKGFAHRDIKPHNFMLDNKFNIRIMDFGFLTDVKKESIYKYWEDQFEKELGNEPAIEP